MDVAANQLLLMHHLTDTLALHQPLLQINQS